MNGQFLIGLSIDHLPTPAPVLDFTAFSHNLEYMSNYLAKGNTVIRPHAKTHKTPIIAHHQLRAGAKGVCCATIGEAEVMAYAGIDDILLANEVIGEDAIRRAVNLARHVELKVVADSLDNIETLSAAARQYGVILEVLVDLDVGLGRCGARTIEQLLLLAKAVHQSHSLRLRGVFGYEGQVQFIADREERTRQGRAANELLVEAAKTLSASGLPIEIVSGAGTGTFDIAAEFPGITEIQAGSYIFMDGTYQKLGLPFKQALTVLSTVISCPTNDLAILDVGLKGISPERFNPSIQGYETTIEIKKLAEEHAVAQIQTGQALRSGMKVQLVPSHCCTTVNLYDYLYVCREGIIEAIWPIAARRA
ncbi:MAG: alanine racemase domain protein [Anaerosporomusa subterranea]|jgi:D-serine deaminase-like pyridoxal phosphate-dependent protein|nr:alanine racemase domain protein [Anaerosporomusa subterranea]